MCLQRRATMTAPKEAGARTSEEFEAFKKIKINFMWNEAASVVVSPTGREAAHRLASPRACACVCIALIERRRWPEVREETRRRRLCESRGTPAPTLPSYVAVSRGGVSVLPPHNNMIVPLEPSCQSAGRQRAHGWFYSSLVCFILLL